MKYYTSDTHFGHENAVQHRPKFKDLDSMNEALIQGWNSVVQPGDEIWHLGDVFFKAYFDLDLLHGTKYHVLGNHDHRQIKILERFFDIKDQIHVDKQDSLVLCHYPILSWPQKRYGWIHLHGHKHGALIFDANAVDVGVDCWDYRPVSLEQIRKRIRKRINERGLMKETLFDEDERYTPKAVLIEQAFRGALKPVFETYSSNTRFRELEHIAAEVAWELGLEYRM